MDSDLYKSIKKPSQGIYKDKGSRFLAYAFPVSSPDEIKPLIDKIRKEHHDARHHCFGYMLGYKRDVWRVNDDGEPSGTAGKPILGQINSLELTNILIVVTRYFGGTLLGVSGLINAYRSAAADSLKNAEVIELTVRDTYEITFPYLTMNDIMKILKEEGAVISGQSFDLECIVRINFRASIRERILKRLSRFEQLKCRYIETT